VNLISNYLSSIKKFISELPDNISKNAKIIFDGATLMFKKSQEIRKTNIDLAKYHFFNGNITDSIFRLIIIDKFFSKNDPEVKNLLGWAYYLKGKIDKAITNFSFDENNNIAILNFLRKSEDYKEIPEEIYLQIRDNQTLYYDQLFVEKSYFNKLMAQKNLPYEFIKHTLLSIPSLGKTSDILDFGGATGLVSLELKSNSISNLEKIVCVEPSNKMLEYAVSTNPNLYYKTYNQNLDQFTKDHTEKYDLIFSFCSLDYSSNLRDIFKQISLMLKPQGCFSFFIRLSSKNTKLNYKKTYFIYLEEDIDSFINEAKYTILNSKKITVNNDNYKFVIVKNLN